MRAPQLFLWLLALITTAHAFALPSTLSWSEASSSLWKRKGGGGKGGSSSSSGTGTGSTSSGSSGGGGVSGVSGTGARTGSGTGTNGNARGSTSSNTGGSTIQGSGPPKSYGGAYGGGASTPYSAGVARSGVSPLLIAPLAIFPGLWLYSAYAYSWGHPWNYRNNTSGRNETLPATCLCEQYQECACDDNNSTDYQNAVANNASISRVADVNGTRTLVINGTLPNGTTSDGGDEDAYDNLASKTMQMSGFWVIIAGVSYAVTFL